MFCCCWTTYLEQLTCQSARQGNQLHRIQKTTKTFMFQMDCSASWLLWLLRIINTFLLTYLLTFLLTYTVVIWVQVGLILRPQIRGDEIRRLLSQQFYGVNGILHATSFASLQGRESQVRRLINVLLNAEFSAKQCSKGIMKITQQLYKLWWKPEWHLFYLGPSVYALDTLVILNILYSCKPIAMKFSM